MNDTTPHETTDIPPKLEIRALRYAIRLTYDRMVAAENDYGKDRAAYYGAILERMLNERLYR